MGTTILIIGGVLAFLLLIVGLIVSSRDERSLVEERLGYLEEDEVAGSSERATPMTDWLGSQAGRFSWGQGLSKSLARADLKMRLANSLR
jgi:tight adherence protein B